MIDPGTYWVSFEPDGGIKGIHPGKAPNPMSEYAQHSGGGWLDWGENYFDYLDVGVRIDATPPAGLPTPGSLALLGAGLAVLAVARRTPVDADDGQRPLQCLRPPATRRPVSARPEHADRQRQVVLSKKRMGRNCGPSTPHTGLYGPAFCSPCSGFSPWLPCPSPGGPLRASVSPGGTPPALRHPWVRRWPAPPRATGAQCPCGSQCRSCLR
jgi:hypothetical protein